MLIKSNCLSEFPGVHVLVSDAARAATPHHHHPQIHYLQKDKRKLGY